MGLETVKDQFDMVGQIPREEQLGWIKQAVQDEEKIKGEFSMMSKVYQEGDMEGLHNLFLQSPEFSGYADLMLYQRNKKWIPIIEEEIKEKSSFIAVGASHLGSDQGVIKLLRNEGYTVRPL